MSDGIIVYIQAFVTVFQGCFTSSVLLWSFISFYLSHFLCTPESSYSVTLSAG
jgi:hypothetical protein